MRYHLGCDAVRLVVVVSFVLAAFLAYIRSPWLLIPVCIGVTLLLRGDRVRRLAPNTKSHLVMLTVILFTVGVAMPFINAPHKAPVDAKERVCVSNIKRIIIAFSEYADDYDGHLPPQNCWPKALLPYTGSEKTYQCPNDTRPMVAVPNVSPLSPMMLSYSMTMEAGGVRIGDMRREDSFPLMYESVFGNPCPRHGRGYIYGYADGRIVRCQSPTYTAVGR